MLSLDYVVGNKDELVVWLIEAKFVLVKVMKYRSIVKNKSKIGLIPNGVMREILNYI